MNDSLFVRGFKRPRNLLRDRQCLVKWHGAQRDPVGERRAFDQFHHQCGCAVALLQPVDLRDVGMVQGGEHFGFPLEAGQSICIGRYGSGKNLDGDSALQIRVGCLVDLPHTADANLGSDFIWAEPRASSESHGKWLRL
jgi:hypothetical protein